jgi:hypothetical protein
VIFDGPARQIGGANERSIIMRTRVIDIPGIAGTRLEETLEGNLLKLVRLAEYSGDKGLVDASIWALYQAWELKEHKSIDPETLAMIGRLSSKAAEPAH